MLNVDWIGRLPAPIRAASYFALQRAIGSRISDTWSDFLSWTRLSEPELHSAIEERLSHALTRATTTSEYYRDQRICRRPNEPVRAFLRRFPILTRKDVRAHFERIVADSLRPEVSGPESASRKRYDWLVVKTGGTTGTPTSVIHDSWFRDYGRATRLFSQKMCGFPLGTRYFRLWGNEQELMQTAESLDRRILRNLLGELPMNAFRAKENELHQQLTMMNRQRGIRHLMAYVDAAAGLADFIRARQLNAPKFDGIMACAGTVTPEWRTILETVFSAEVFDKYGSRECADIACECRKHSGLHVYSPNVFVEIVNDSGSECGPGETGRILITLLNNHSFPLIRYEIGDLAMAADNSTGCACGLPFPRIGTVQGRMDDMLTTADGTKLSSVFVRHFVGVSLNRELIHTWQLEQTEETRFIFRYTTLSEQRAPHALEENVEDLRKAFISALGENVHIRFERCKEILPGKSGKFRWILNSTKTPAA